MVSGVFTDGCAIPNPGPGGWCSFCCFPPASLRPRPLRVFNAVASLLPSCRLPPHPRALARSRPRRPAPAAPLAATPRVGRAAVADPVPLVVVLQDPVADRSRGARCPRVPPRWFDPYSSGSLVACSLPAASSISAGVTVCCSFMWASVLATRSTRICGLGAFPLPLPLEFAGCFRCQSRACVDPVGLCRAVAAARPVARLLHLFGLADPSLQRLLAHVPRCPSRGRCFPLPAADPGADLEDASDPLPPGARLPAGCHRPRVASRYDGGHQHPGRQPPAAGLRLAPLGRFDYGVEPGLVPVAQSGRRSGPPRAPVSARPAGPPRPAPPRRSPVPLRR